MSSNSPPHPSPAPKSRPQPPQQPPKKDPLLDAGAGPLEPPVRSVLFGPARFEQHGHSLARAHETISGTTSGANFFPRLQGNITMLRYARAQLELRAQAGSHLGPAAHWLLDNAPLIDEQLHAIRRGLPRSFFRLLPRLRDEPLAGLPRIYGVAWAWVAHTDSGFDAALMTSYLRAYQAERELSLAELWALPTTLRVVLVENLRRLAERSATQQAARDAAHHWFDQDPDAGKLGELDVLALTARARGVEEAFLLQLDQRQEELPPEVARALDAWLATRLPDPAAALAHQQSEATEDQQSIRNAIMSLRQLDRADWRELIQGISSVMQTLQQGCPVHAAEARETQDETLHAVERLARRSGRSEATVAQLLVSLCRAGSAAEPGHGGAPAYWWRGPGKARLHEGLGLRPPMRLQEGGRVHRALLTLAYLGGLLTLTLGGVGWLLAREASPLAPGWLLALAAFLMLGPASEAVVALVNRWISESVRPRKLPRLAFADGLPDSQRSLVVMPAMLSSEPDIADLCAQLEQHYLANAEPCAQFALLSDDLDAAAKRMPGDEALFTAAYRGITELNERHPAAEGQPTRFLLLHRERLWSETEQRWIGWERKRGKLEQLVRLLAEPGYRPFIELGPFSTTAENTRYIVTLDADTDMPPGRLRSLVGMAAHPLNQPRWDGTRRRMIGGYAILQPRVIAPLALPGQTTFFHQLSSGPGGIDPYSAASSEIYQDLFGEGTFTGKGLLHVQALHAVLGNRLPEGQVLSHDLLEGSIARCAGVSDVTLMEDSPAHPDVAAARLHRWTRGDWQLLPFLARASRYGITPINRWKMLDNLRRSLVAPMSLALLVLVLASGVLPLAWALAVVAAAFCAGPLLGAVAGMAPSRDDVALRLFYRHAGADLLRALGQAAWHGAQLLQQSLMLVDAIARALHRQFVSRRHLLQWTTAAQAQAAAQSELGALIRQHRRVPIAAAVLLLGLGGADLLGAPVQWPAAALLAALWAAAPLWTWLASRPRHGRPQETLDEAGQQYLHGLARDTWRFYEQHIGSADNHLPPDNVQQTPTTIVAHRTSPTNIGLYLLAVACARELGFIGVASMVDRLEATLDTLDKLPRWRGHFYNWYDTQTLAVLTPAYVSSVDSGNCSGLMLAVARACEAAAADPHSHVQQALQHSLRRLRALQPVLAGTPQLRTLSQLAEGAWAWPETHEDAREIETRVQHARRELDALHQRLGGEQGGSWLMHDLISSLESAMRDLQQDLTPLRERLKLLALRTRAMALEADYKPLYDRERRLLHIGYRVEQQQVDENHYDLLASEARLTSLIGIAKGDLPVEHWGALGRPFFAEGSREVGLKSWSGSMFEYLMPSLLLDEPFNSALGQAGRSAVAEQRREGREHGTPWGSSESAIAGQDHTLAYQYGPQGAARLALRRVPADERVLAPYATVLAAMVAPCPAVANLRALEKLGARQALGFIEALDYTPQRQMQGPTQGKAGTAYTRVDTFMTHHQSMSLVALTNLLADNAPRRWAMGDAHIRAVSALLHERSPREVARLPAASPAPQARGPRGARLVRETAPLLDGGLPLTQLLTNGRHSVVLRSHGAGYSTWSGVGLSRWREDLQREHHGSFFYLQRDDTHAPWHSLTAHPAPDRAARYGCRMQADRVVFEARWAEQLHASSTIWVSPEDDCELRQVELCNLGNEPMSLRLVACFEATLSAQRADEAHPAFANLFIQQRWQADERVMHLQRRPRLADEPVVRAVCFLAAVEGRVEEVTPIADRARWLGRYGSAARPLGDCGFDFIDEGPELDNGLDPLAGMLVRLSLPPGSTVKLTFCTAASRDADTLEALIDKYQQPSLVQRAASMSHTMAGIRLRELQFDAETWGAMLYINTLITGQASRESMPALRQPTPATARCDRRLLWRHGISGERPLIWVSISGEEGLDLVVTLKKTLRLWTAAGLGVDLVISNGEPTSYLSPVQNQLQQLQARQQAQQHHDQPEHLRSRLHLLLERDLGPDERHTLQTLARIKLLADGRSLAQQLERWVDEHHRINGIGPGEQRRTQQWPVAEALPSVPRGTALPPDGRFNAEHGGFAFEMSPSRHPARPWVNVLANPAFGCQVSELGAGYTWAGNSRMHMVTPWSNDPLTDPPGEWLLLQDLDRGRSQVLALGRRLNDRSAGEVEHGIGWTRITQQVDDLSVTLTWCVDDKASVKQVQIALASRTRRRLRVVALAEWVLGSAPVDRLSLNARPHWLSVGPEGAGLPRPGSALALQATQMDHAGGFGGATAFLSLRPPQPGDPESADPVQLLAQDWTCDRREFFDASGALVLPGQLAQRSGCGLDACAALGALLSPQPGMPAHITVLLGHAPSAAAAQTLLAEAWALAPHERLARQREQWPALLGGVKVKTPDARFDALVNHWLPYQTLACRMWARAGFYQAGGAFGFRDQLQDAMALTTHAPQLLAEQIRRNAARQFAEGDVQHWWHEPGGAGVRTHFSDDRLWLPYALALYVQRTGDLALLDETQPWLVGREVPEGAEDVYETPGTSEQRATLYEHAARAIDRSLTPGSHGLPLFGTGDWNDGMNRVGHEGRGESVWLAWFICRVIDDFMPTALARGDKERAGRWRTARKQFASALDTEGWDGRWYLRGYFDDGSKLGSAGRSECRIDLIAQAWAVLSGAGDPARARQAMASACAELVDPAGHLVRLLDPPLQNASPSAGYIQSYPPGVRENGGQYNHGAVWALMALAALGQREPMWQMFTALSPAHRWMDRRRGTAYAIEPYVMAGDVYTHTPWVGRGGWSWYTGSAGWLLRASVESICGVVLADGRVTVRPCLPAHWSHAEVSLRHNGQVHRIIVCAEQIVLDQAAAAEPGAVLARAGEAIELSAWPEGSVQLVLADEVALVEEAAQAPVQRKLPLAR